MEQLGIAWKWALNGLIGALVWALHTKSKLWDAVRQVFIGSVVAGYCTPAIAEKMNIGINYICVLSFTIGMLGMVIIDTLYKGLLKKIKLLL